MKIISPFKDYYDTILSYGADSTITYKREEKKFDTEFRFWDTSIDILKLLQQIPSGIDYGFSPAILGFCGRAYPIWTYIPKFYEDYSIDGRTANGVIKHYEDIRSRCQKGTLTRWEDPQFYKKSVAMFFDRESGPYYRNFYQKDVIKAEKEITGVKLDLEIFHKLKSPIILVTLGDQRSSLGKLTAFTKIFYITNISLKKIGFQSVIDPFKTFQEIAMFMSSILGVEDKAPLRVGSDKIIAQAKGFDECSFRTMAPGTKKLNRQENRKRKRGL